MSVMKVVIGVLILLIGWDVVTTYYGTLSIFVGTSANVSSKLSGTSLTVHVVAIIFAIALITFILSYKHILRANNAITKGTLFVAFIYDFGTSIFGTASALGVIGSRTNGSTPAQWAIIFLLAIMATSAPLLIHQVLED